jgi:Uma2 family endonuclease
MSIAVETPRTTSVEEFLAIPEDGIARELINGEVREVGMTLRNHTHGEVLVNVSHRLKSWQSLQPAPRGRVVGGDAGFRFGGELELILGPDVAVASAELVARTPKLTAFYEGPPILAVEILSPSDKHEAIVEKVRLYLEHGVVVWVVDPDFRNVLVHRPGHPEQLFSAAQELVGDPYLPGFRANVAEFFED